MLRRCICLIGALLVAAVGTVPMSRHGGAWKVGTENWSSKPR